MALDEQPAEQPVEQPVEENRDRDADDIWAMTAYGNGQLPASGLAPLTGNPGKQLRNDAAAGFNAMYAEHPVHVADAYRQLGSPGDLSRGRWSQWAAWERYRQGGNLAAYPGRSNHGWGLAIDTASYYDRQIIDHIGAKYGWAKTWSDAPSEFWHVLFKPGVWHPATSIWPLKQGDHGDRVHQVQRALQARGHGIQADGSYGAQTAGAVRVFERNHHLDTTGTVTQSVWNFLFPTLHVGSEWPGAVGALQAALKHRGYRIRASGQYGTITKYCVIVFQRRHGLRADGVCGPVTWRRLFE